MKVAGCRAALYPIHAYYRQNWIISSACQWFREGVGAKMAHLYRWFTFAL